MSGIKCRKKRSKSCHIPEQLKIYLKYKIVLTILKIKYLYGSFRTELQQNLSV